MRAEQPTFGGPPTSCYERFGCEVNHLSVDELFQRYMETGFLYPDKLQRLAPFTREILDNWRRAAASPDGLLRVVTHRGGRERSWASLATWRHTEGGWCTQHLVSRGDPLASRAVMLAEQEAMIEDPLHLSNQNWFRPNNRMPRRLFGTISERLGTESACESALVLFEVPLQGIPLSSSCSVQRVESSNQARLAELAAAARGSVYVAAEEIADPDFAMSRLDRLYRRVGLFRFRRAWLARARGELVAALVAYRGPLGLNYSFIENRADLLIDPTSSDGELLAATHALVRAATDCYADFRPGYIPLCVDERWSRALVGAGFRPIRSYCQTLWLRSGYARYHAHLQATFARVAARAERRTAGGAFRHKARATGNP